MTGPLVIASYFREICLEVLQKFMGSHGFEYQRKEDFQGVIFKKNTLIVEVSYWPEDFPDYAPCINIGFFESGSYSAVGLWEAIPVNADDNYSSWRFDNDNSLRISMTKLRDRVLAIHGPLLWSDNRYLKKIIANHEANLQANYQKVLQKEIKGKAEKAFREGNYSKAISLYAKIPKTDLSKIDMKRIDIMKKKQK